MYPTGRPILVKPTKQTSALHRMIIPHYGLDISQNDLAQLSVIGKRSPGVCPSQIRQGKMNVTFLVQLATDELYCSSFTAPVTTQ